MSVDSPRVAALMVFFQLCCANSGAQQAQEKITPPPSLKKCTPSDGAVYYALSCPTTARVTKIEKAVVDVPGSTVEDYDTCIKRAKDWPEGVLKESVKKNCKLLEDLGGSPGYHPGYKSPGYVITFETSLAVYVISAQAKCGNVKPDGTCDFSGGPGVVVGDTYIFEPPTGDSTLVELDELENGIKHFRLMGHINSVTEKAATDKPKK